MKIVSTVLTVALLGGAGYYLGSNGWTPENATQKASKFVDSVLPTSDDLKEKSRQGGKKDNDHATSQGKSAHAVDAASYTQSATPLTRALNKIRVKGRAPTTGYTREQYGDGWRYADGCDTRNLILQRDLKKKRFEAGSTCVVISGVLKDPYGGKRIHFTRGETTSMAVQIDHVVALSDSWQKGAQKWSPEKRENFANDPLNLVAADGPLNMAKSDGDAATWLPPNKAYRCEYVAAQTAVKAKYGLWMTSAEKNAIRRILNGCPNQTLPR